jgi:glycosyltransferase involved in cell wall biosynthesis
VNVAADLPSGAPRPPVVCFSTVDWHYLWHRPQAVMSRLAADGFPVLFVETIGVRSPGWRDWRRVAGRLQRGLRGGGHGPEAPGGPVPAPPPGLALYSPLVLPFLDSPLACRLNAAWLTAALQRRLARLAPGVAPIIWVYLPSWTVLQCVRRLRHQALVVEAIDALASNPAGVSKGFIAAEQELLRRAGLVLATSETLCAERVPLNANTHWVPAGVEASFFGSVAAAAEVAAIRPPRFGFFGALDHRIDIGLLTALAAARPDWSWVLIGPQRTDLRPLLVQRNVHWLGARAHAQLPSLLAGLEVTVLPYVEDDFTRHVFPAKIYECLALGKPTVATALPALARLVPHVRLARGQAGFTAALEAALADTDPVAGAARVTAARANGWDARYGQLRDHLDRLLGVP